MIATLLFALIGCGEAKLGLAGACNLTSECDTPLVCRLERCRTECATARDCPIGAQCLLDAQEIGSCQLVEEGSCSRDSDCAFDLVCRNAGCVNKCDADRDCPVGARCIARDGTGCAGDMCSCEDPAATACTLATDCLRVEPSGALACGLDGRCRARCVSDRDCLFGAPCDRATGLCEVPDGGFRFPDAGDRRDAGVSGDAGPDGGRPACLLDRATALALGAGVACAIVGTGQVACWGSTLEGGPPPPPDTGEVPFGGRHRRRPEILPGVDDAIDISAAYAHVCILHRDGTVSCFGDNTFGQLGDGTEDDHVLPAPVSGVSGATAISVGGDQSCALVGPETMMCWGNASQGRLGDGRSGTGELAFVPVSVALPSATATIALSRSGGCALAEDGVLSCWGLNASGEAGVGTTAITATPTVTMTSVRFAEVDGGEADTCAIDDAGVLYCWGQANMARAPVPFGTSLAEHVSRSTGGCILQRDRTAACWFLFPGDGTSEIRDVPGAPVTGIPEVDEVEAGAGAACARAGGAVYCWGRNSYGELGDGTEVPSLLPVRVSCER